MILNENDRQTGSQHPCRVGEIDEVHPVREHHIGQQQIRCAGPLKQQERFGRGLRDQHAVPKTLELPAHDAPSVGFVLDDEDRASIFCDRNSASRVCASVSCACFSSVMSCEETIRTLEGLIRKERISRRPVKFPSRSCPRCAAPNELLPETRQARPGVLGISVAIPSTYDEPSRNHACAATAGRSLRMPVALRVSQGSGRRHLCGRSHRHTLVRSVRAPALERFGGGG